MTRRCHKADHNLLSLRTHRFELLERKLLLVVRHFTSCKILVNLTKKEQSVNRSFLLNYIYLRTSLVTSSTCGVCGNISMAFIASTS